MKKIIFILLLIGNISIAQTKKNAVGIYYPINLTNTIVNDNYIGLIGLSANFNLVSFENIKLNTGLNTDLFLGNTPKYDNFRSQFSYSINPNIGIEIVLSNKKIKPFFNLGYAYTSFNKKVIFSKISNFNYPDPTVGLIKSSGKTNNVYNSVTIQPGLNFQISDSFQIQAAYKLSPLTSEFYMHILSFGTQYLF